MAILIVATTLIVGSVLYVLVARYSPEGGREHQTPTNVYFVTGGAMSLLIAFTMSLTFSQYLSAQQASLAEAEAVVAMSRGAMFMAPSLRDPLRNQLACYAEEVIGQEWPAMQQGASSVSPTVRATLIEMDSLLASQTAVAGPGLGVWESANQTRHAAHIERLQAAANGVPTILWMLLVFGSVITIGSLFVFADKAKPAWGHALVVIGPLFVASAALVVIAFFDHPYADTPGGIPPTAMQTTLISLTQAQLEGIPAASCPGNS